MAITKEQIQGLAKLSRLEFSEEEQEDLIGDLNEIVNYMEKLKELDLENVEPMMRVDESLRPMREDDPKSGLTKEQAFQNAPSINLDHFSIPKTVK